MMAKIKKTTSIAVPSKNPAKMRREGSKIQTAMVNSPKAKTMPIDKIELKQPKPMNMKY